MKMITPFDPTAQNSGSFDPGVANPCGRLYLFNESPVWLQLTFCDGSIAGLPAFYCRSFYIPQKGPVKWQKLSTLGTGTAPISIVYGESYESAEAKRSNFAEGPLARLTNIGNNVPINTVSTSVINDGNTASTTFIEATQSGAPGSNVVIDNSGNLTIAEYVAGVRTPLLQTTAGTGVTIGSVSPSRPLTANGLFVNSGLTVNAGKIYGSGGWVWMDFSGSNLAITPNGGSVNINSNLTVSGTVNSGTINSSGDINANSGGFNGNIALYGGKIFGSGGWVYADINSTSPGKIIFTPNGSTLKIASASLEFQDGSLVNQIHGFSGTGTGTFNHLCSRAPNIIQLTTSQVGSQTMGYDSVTSTQVHVTSGAGLAWTGLALYLG